jgi:amidase
MNRTTPLIARSARELSKLLRANEISPLELVDACIERISAENPRVNALCATNFDTARKVAKLQVQQANAGGKKPLLWGLPIGVKDLEDTAGLLTTYGNPGRNGNVPQFDHHMVARIRAAGANILAKTNTPDMGAGANTRNPVWGATGNPFNPNLNAGGSSGGSAAGLALDMFPLATGSDTGGSLRIPSAWCGIVGMRPTAGVVGCNSRALGWSPISVLGPMARDVSDCAFFLEAMAGVSPLDPLSYPIAEGNFWPLKAGELSQLRIGYTTDFGHCAIDADIAHSFKARIEFLAPRVARCEEVPFSLGDVDRAFDIQRAITMVSMFAHIERSAPETLGPNLIENLRIARALTIEDAAWGHQQHTHIAREFARLIGPAPEQFDLILAPVLPVSPMPWTELFAATVGGKPMKNYYHWLAHCYTVTLGQGPVLSLPTGLDAQGMPFGLQVIGAMHRDAKLLQDALALETAFQGATQFARPKPPENIHAANPALTSLITHPPAPHLIAS